MRSILILNAKGGCGKSTIATNLAGYYADRGKQVTLADFDPQASSLGWLEARPADFPEITGLAAWQEGTRIPNSTEYLIMDAPAGIHGREMGNLIRRAESIIIPVLPSPMDMRAADSFIEAVRKQRNVVNRDVKLATVANRVRENTIVSHSLATYLQTLKLPDGKKFPCHAVLRASQNYIRAAERGLSLFEFAPAATQVDREHWMPLLRWLGSARSRPQD